MDKLSKSSPALRTTLLFEASNSLVGFAEAKGRSFMQQSRFSYRMARKTFTCSGGCSSTRIKRPPLYFPGVLHRFLLCGGFLFSLFLSESAHAATTPARENDPTAPNTSNGTKLKSGFEERVALLRATGRPLAVVSDALDHGPGATTENDALPLPALITSDRDGGGPDGIIDVTDMSRHRTEQHGKPSSHSASRSLVSEEGVDSGESYSSGGEKRVKFMLDGRVESYMAGDTMQGYLNDLVNITMANTKNQARKKDRREQQKDELRSKSRRKICLHVHIAPHSGEQDV